MSFNKRFLSKGSIIANIDNIMNYLGNADAVFLEDDFSVEVFKLYQSGATEDYLKQYIMNDKKTKEHVDHPDHYGGKDSVYEAIKVIDAWDLGFSLGNTVKYISRAGKKDPKKELEDLHKAAWYLQHHIEQLENKQK